MMNLFRDPEPDPELGNALRRIEASWERRGPEALRRNIVAGAAPKLTGLRLRAPRWWELLSSWSRVAVPVGLAASLGAGLLLRGSGDVPPDIAYGTDMGADSTLVLAALSEPATGSLFTGHLIAPMADDWLLRQAVEQ